jgi:hypothetical protein
MRRSDDMINPLTARLLVSSLRSLGRLRLQIDPRKWRIHKESVRIASAARNPSSDGGTCFPAKPALSYSNRSV